MNTKAQAPATNAPTAKDDNKTGNTKVQFVAVTEKEDNDYQDLHSRHLDLNEEEEARYMELAKKIRAAKNARKAKIDEVKSDLRKMAFSIKDVFAAEDIKAAFQITDLFSQPEIDAAATKKAGGKGSNSEKARKESTPKVFASSSNPVFIKIPRLDSDHQRTNDVIIHQGRANEFYQGKRIFGPLSKPLARTKGKDEKETEANLAKYVVDAAYAKTDDGKAELKKIAAEVFAYKE